MTIKAQYSVSTGPSCCFAPPPPPPLLLLLLLQGNLLIGMQAVTWSCGALAPSLKGLAPRSFLSPSFSLSVYCAPPLTPLRQLSQYLLGTRAGEIVGVEEPG